MTADKAKFDVRDRALRVRNVTQTLLRSKAAPRQYAGWMAGQIFFQLVVVLSVIEAIFVAEKLEGVLHFATEYRSPWSDVILLLAYSSPAVADLALPIGLLVASYVVCLKCREQRELIALAAAGVGACHFIFFALALGLSFQLCSLFISGIIEPHAKFEYRRTEFLARNQALLNATALGKAYSIGKYVVMTGPIEPSGTTAIFMKQAMDETTDRITIAHRPVLDGPDEQGRYALQLQDVTGVDVQSIIAPQQSQITSAECDRCGPRRLYTVKGNVQIEKYTDRITFDDFLKFAPRGLTIAEWSLVDLWNSVSSSTAVSADLGAEMVKRFARSLLCLIGPLIAGLAVSFATRRMQAFALPIACAVLMCADIAGTVTATVFAPSWFPVVLISGTALVFAGFLIWQTVARMHALLIPAIAR